MNEINLNPNKVSVKENGKEAFILEDLFSEFVEVNKKREEFSRDGKTPADLVEWYKKKISDKFGVLLEFGSVEELIYQIDLAWVKKNKDRAKVLNGEQM